MARLSFASEGAAIQLADELLIVMQHGTAIFDGHKHDRDLNFLISLLSVRAFNSLWRSRQCAVEGYAVQSMTLSRAALEDWIAVRWLEVRPDQKNLWLGHMLAEVPPPVDGKGREQWLPGADEMLDDLPEKDSVRLAYRSLSRVAHPRGSGLAWQFHADSNSLYVHAGPNFDATDLRRSLFFIVHIAAGSLPSLERLQERWLGHADPDWVSRGIAAVEQSQKFLRRVADEVVPPDEAGAPRT